MDVWNPHLLSHKMDMLQNMVCNKTDHVGKILKNKQVHYKIFFNRPFGPIIKTVEMTIQTIDELNMEKSIVQ